MLDSRAILTKILVRLTSSGEHHPGDYRRAGKISRRAGPGFSREIAFGNYSDAVIVQ